MKKFICVILLIISCFSYGQSDRYVPITYSLPSDRYVSTEPKKRVTEYKIKQENKNITQTGKEKINEEQKEEERKEEERLTKIQNELRAADTYFEQKNYTDAYKLYMQYEKYLDEEQQYRMAWMYFEGKGTTKDYAKAKIYFEKVAVKGNNDAMNALGYLYYKGLGVEKDNIEARYWYKKAVDAGNVNAQLLLGLVYAEEKDYTNAVTWIKKAATKTKDPMAYENLLYVYMNNRDFGSLGEYSVKMEELFGYSPIKKMAEEGKKEAIAFLAAAYLNGLGYKKDYDVALIYVNQLPEKDILVKLMYRGYINYEKGYYEAALKDFTECYKKKPYAPVLDFIVLCYFSQGKNDKARSWAKKESTPLTNTIHFYYKCKNAMTVSDFDYCVKYQSYYKNLSTYLPFEDIEKELNLYFKVNYKEKLDLSLNK